MSVQGYSDLRGHVGHTIECVTYGLPGDEPHNVALECTDCCEVLVDFDHPAVERGPAPTVAMVRVGVRFSDRGRAYAYEAPAAWKLAVGDVVEAPTDLIYTEPTNEGVVATLYPEPYDGPVKRLERVLGRVGKPR